MNNIYKAFNVSNDVELNSLIESLDLNEEQNIELFSSLNESMSVDGIRYMIDSLTKKYDNGSYEKLQEYLNKDNTRRKKIVETEVKYQTKDFDEKTRNSINCFMRILPSEEAFKNRLNKIIAEHEVNEYAQQFFTIAEEIFNNSSITKDGKTIIDPLWKYGAELNDETLYLLNSALDEDKVRDETQYTDMEEFIDEVSNKDAIEFLKENAAIKLMKVVYRLIKDAYDTYFVNFENGTELPKDMPTGDEFTESYDNKHKEKAMIVVDVDYIDYDSDEYSEGLPLEFNGIRFEVEENVEDMQDEDSYPFIDIVQGLIDDYITERTQTTFSGYNYKVTYNGFKDNKKSKKLFKNMPSGDEFDECLNESVRRIFTSDKSDMVITKILDGIREIKPSQFWQEELSNYLEFLNIYNDNPITVEQKRNTLEFIQVDDIFSQAYEDIKDYAIQCVMDVFGDVYNGEDEVGDLDDLSKIDWIHNNYTITEIIEEVTDDDDSSGKRCLERVKERFNNVKIILTRLGDKPESSGDEYMEESYDINKEPIFDVGDKVTFMWKDKEISGRIIDTNTIGGNEYFNVVSYNTEKNRKETYTNIDPVSNAMKRIEGEDNE